MACMRSKHGAARLGPRARRLLITLVLASTCLLLVAPAVANAHVKPKYRTTYAKELVRLTTLFGIYEGKFKDAETHLLGLVEQLKPMIGDPGQREQLLDGETYARRIYNSNFPLPPQWQHSIAVKLRADRAKGKLWFSTAKDRAAFKHGTEQLQIDFGCLMVAHSYLYEAFQALSMDPPALELEATKQQQADDNYLIADDQFPKDFATLKKLR
jgi:hypothetical protein